MYPHLPFYERSFSAEKLLALTFDDGPDGSARVTDRILDTLDTLGVTATFFLNGYNYTDVANDPIAQTQIRRIVAEGHDLGNHSMTHARFENLTAEQAEDEFRRFEELVHTEAVLGKDYPPLTLLRLPWGQPLRSGLEAEAWVGPVCGKFGVHIGWNMYPRDWDGTAKEIVERVLRMVDAGMDGTILLHCTHVATAEALPSMIKRLRERGFRFVGMEEYLVKRFGKTSKELQGDYLSQKDHREPVGKVIRKGMTLENNGSVEVNDGYPERRIEDPVAMADEENTICEATIYEGDGEMEMGNNLSVY